MLHKISCTSEITSMQGRLNGIKRLSVFLVPVAGSTVKFVPALFIQAATSIVLHSFGEEGMIAIPLPGSVKRIEKKIGLIQPREYLCAILATQERITEWGAQTTEQAGLQEKGLQCLRLGVEHVGDQIFNDMLMATGKGCQRLLNFAWILCGQSQGQQTQSSDPALNALIELAQRFRPDGKRQGLLEKAARLLQRETQVGCPQFAEVVMGAPTSQG